MNNAPNYCSNCGVPLRGTETTCFACGARTGATGRLPDPTVQQKRLSNEKAAALTVAAILSLLWGMTAIIAGASFLLLEHILELEPEFLQEIFGTYFISAKVWIISGVLSLITAFTIFSKKNNFMIALLTCIAASVIALPVGAVGFVVVLLIIFSRTQFSKQSI